jgi:Xaa-Pro aminopeptidase
VVADAAQAGKCESLGIGRTRVLTEAGCRGRRQRLWAALDERPDWILLQSPRNLSYFTGYYPSPFLFSTQNAQAMLLLGQDGSSLLIADNLLLSFASRAFVDRVDAPLWYRSRESAARREELLVKAATDALGNCPGATLGLDASVPALVADRVRQSGRDLRLVDVGPVVHRLMRSKDEDEVALLRRCMDVAGAGFAAALAGIEPGMTELQAYELVSNACMEAAGEPVILYGDFASGTRTEQGGGGPTDRVIGRDDLFILDCSVVINGYRGDFANTFVVAGGRATLRQKELEAACLEAMAAGEKSLQVGVAGRDVHEAVRSSLAAKGLDSLFTHHSGHGLGLGHPDPPYLVPESDDTLVAGDVVTLEPGLYEPGTGGMRFERNYLITDSGPVTLTSHYLGLERPTL